MGLLSPWFLGGLAALGIPVFVHLLRRHVTIPRPVGSLMFFERGTQSSTRHRRLKYLLLFALRTALVLLVVLAFAKPFVVRPAGDRPERLLVIVLDHSFSMRAGDRFARARAEALRTLAGKAPSRKAEVIALGGEVEVLTQPVADDAELRAALAGIQPGDGRANFGDLGRAVRSLDETARQPIDLHLFSDMQRSSMPSNFADLVMPADVALTLHSVAESGTPPPNWTVESIEAPVELSDPKDPRRSRVHAVVAGFHTPAANKTVELVVNGKSVASRKIEVPVNGRAAVDFSPLDVGYGFSRCAVRIDGNDALPADDEALFSVRRSDPERVLFVHAGDDVRSGTYFRSALGAAAENSFVVESMNQEQTADLDPSRFAFVVLSDVASLPTIFEHALSQYVANGGSVWIALGTHAPRRAPIPLWGKAIGEVRDYARLPRAASVGQVDFTHPALEQDPPGRDNGGWAEVKVFYANVVDPGQSRVAARLDDGTPLLLDRPEGEGHLLLLTSGLDNLTNDLPLHPVFVALVDRAARYLSGSARLSGSKLVDSFVQLRPATKPTGTAAGVEVIAPDGRRPLSLAEARSAETLRLTHAGFYQIRFANGQDAVIGVNPDRRESDLEPIAPDVLALWGKSSAGIGEQPGPGASALPVAGRIMNLWWYVMLFALMAGLAETVVASAHMGTQREDV